VAILVKEGQRVSAGSPLALLSRREQKAGEHSVIKAPIGGMVAVRRVRVGQKVKAGTTLFHLSDPDRLRAELMLPEAYFGAIHAGHMVTLVPPGEGKGAMAKITRVNPPDPTKRTFRVVIDLDNRRARLPGGMSVLVTFDPPLPRKKV
jgi:multidrug efflux pump subunit AcrA (membrane-fusion protein)